jgi:hypothetical protein
MQCCLAALRPAGGAPACGVHLSPFDGNLAAVACADHSAYVYDLRRAEQPLLQLTGHARAVSYVRWLSPSSLATASIDASLAVWQLPGPQQQEQQRQNQQHQQQQQQTVAGSATAVLAQPSRWLRGHRNSKNFCGLAVRPEEGLLACGSEASACYAYHENWSSPLAVHRFGALPPGLCGVGPNCGCGPLGAAGGSGISGGAALAPAGQFCSAVCWQPATARPAGAPPMLATAMSSGDLRVLEMRLPPPAPATDRLDG